MKVAIQGLVAYKPVAYKKVFIDQLNDILSYDPDRKRQSLCCLNLVPTAAISSIAHLRRRR